MHPPGSGRFVKRLVLASLVWAAGAAQAMESSSSLDSNRLHARHAEVREALRDCERGLFLMQRESGLQRSQADTLRRINQWFILFEQQAIERDLGRLDQLSGDDPRRPALSALAEDWRAFLDCEDAVSDYDSSRR